jgi:rhodanese-related sulfurtransferase
MPIDTDTTTGTAADMVANARVPELGPDEFAAEIVDGTAVVIDVREADERARDGSIRGAIHIPRGMLEFRADPSSAHHDERLHPSRRILLHCETGDRSALAAEALTTLGYDDVAHLAGGLNAWKAAGLPLVPGQPAPPY